MGVKLLQLGEGLTEHVETFFALKPIPPVIINWKLKLNI